MGPKPLPRPERMSLHFGHLVAQTRRQKRKVGMEDRLEFKPQLHLSPAV